MSFYPDIKRHISPSAFAAWHNSPGSFVKSYFQNIRVGDTASMKSGKKIHALIEGGLLEVKHRYEHREKTLEHSITPPVEVDVKEITYTVLGIPDSYESEPRFNTTWEGGLVEFVDYKSGKENNEDNYQHAMLSGDLKMKMTAWLVWNEAGKPKNVLGFIEYIPTQWNPISREIEPTSGESMGADKFLYTAQEMEEFTPVILSTIAEINAAYEVWLESSDDFISQDDVTEYARLEKIIRDATLAQEPLLERIAEQMTFGKKEAYQSMFGSFYFKSNKTYDYPKGLRINYRDMGITLEDSVEIAAAASGAKKKFELENTPTSVTRKLQFRIKKVKNNKE